MPDHTPLADKLREITARLIYDCRLAIDYEERFLNLADQIATFERAANEKEKDHGKRKSP